MISEGIFGPHEGFQTLKKEPSDFPALLWVSEVNNVSMWPGHVCPGPCPLQVEESMGSGFQVFNLVSLSRTKTSSVHSNIYQLLVFWDNQPAM